MQILLAIDHSQASQNAIAEVLARVWPAHSRFDVLTVIEPLQMWTPSETADVISRGASELLQATLDRLRSAGLDAEGGMLQGDPKTAILDRAIATSANLIVMGTHSGSAIEHFFWGNVAANVLRHSPCSVLIARSKPISGPKILLATDGSKFSDAAAKSLAMRDWPESTEVRVLSVVEFVLSPGQTLFEPPFVESEPIQKVREDALKLAQEAVASAVTILEKKFTNISESISVLLDRPHTLILKEAQDWNADLIVMGSHGRRGADRFLLGSVSEAVATHAHCSVEVIR